MIVGNPSVFAIESDITQPYARLSQRALGFFVIHVGGRTFGVRSPEATLLACSLDAVRRRIARRGMHRAPFGSVPDAVKIVDAFRAATYDEDRQDERFFGMSSDEFRSTVASNEIVLAPDGDAAFDDGSHVLQFDEGDRVRVIAFQNAANLEEVARTIIETWLSADEFYELLDQWQRRFEDEWRTALKGISKGSGAAE